jgi:RimJ/RimL family protein N-acetyltransferase
MPTKKTSRDKVTETEERSAPPGDNSAAVADAPDSAFMISDRLWYRAPEASDAPRIAVWRTDPRMRRTTTPRFPLAVEAVRKWIENQNPWERGKANDHACFMFGLRGTAEAIGYAGLFAMDWLNRHAEFGVAVDAAHWNQGYGREATGQMLKYAFTELNLHRVELQVLASNTGGIKAYRAAGFVHEGTKRQVDFVDGHWEDVLLMAVLRDEWPVNEPEYM